MLRVVESIQAVREACDEARKAGKRVGLIPTMGALHEGHLQLVEACREEAEFVVVSIFVNPTQFGPSEDFTRYPRTLEADVAGCEKAGADLIFAPSASTMYPRGFSATHVEVAGISDMLEGASRPGHFRGVATVVLKLFTIVQPDVAHFGAKDYQQQLVIRRMVEDLNVHVAVRVVPTVREADGLAMSSRNRYLSPEQRAAATVLSRALSSARDAVHAGLRQGDRVRQILRETIECERLANLDYAEVADADTLEPLGDWEPGRRVVALLAVRVGSTRLIDNLVLAE